MASPLVSILIPAYKPRHFEFALLSAIHQSYDNIEIIVSDDSAGTEIESIVNKCSVLRPIHYCRNPNPDGLGSNNCLNCLKEAKGEFIKFLFDDDVLMPFCVQYMVRVFESRRLGNPRLVFSERWVIDGDCRYKMSYRLPVTQLADVTRSHGERYIASELLNPVGEFSTVMWRRNDTFDDEGRAWFTHIDGRPIKYLVDVAMWINLSRLGALLYIPLPLSCFRLHGGQNTANRDLPEYHRLFTEWEVVVDQAIARNVISHAEGLKAYMKLADMYRSRTADVPSLVPCLEQVEKRIQALMPGEG